MLFNSNASINNCSKIAILAHSSVSMYQSVYTDMNLFFYSKPGEILIYNPVMLNYENPLLFKEYYPRTSFYPNRDLEPSGPTDQFRSQVIYYDDGLRVIKSEPIDTTVLLSVLLNNIRLKIPRIDITIKIYCCSVTGYIPNLDAYNFHKAQDNEEIRNIASSSNLRDPIYLNRSEQIVNFEMVMNEYEAIKTYYVNTFKPQYQDNQDQYNQLLQIANALQYHLSTAFSCATSEEQRYKVITEKALNDTEFRYLPHRQKYIKYKQKYLKLKEEIKKNKKN